MKSGKSSPKTKACFACQNAKPRLYRIKHDASKKWDFVCDACWEKYSKNNPFYVYGGTWKGSAL
jgi:hypothetical protein